MPPREPLARPARADALVAVLVAALGLSTLETVYAFAERWYHAPAYFALSAGLTLALALAVGLASALLRLSPGLALAAWCGLCLGFSWGWIDGAAGFAVAALATLPSFARRTRPAVLGAVAALALACAYLKCTAFAEHLGHKDDFVYESVGAALLLPLTLCALAFVLALLPARVSSGLRVAGLLLFGCVVSLRPRLERGDGEHRQPPDGYASSAPRVAGEKKPNVFVIVLDTVRADHLSLYGYERETTPELAHFFQSRKNAVLYPRAYANGTWTVPSHGSLFTGQLPGTHGAHFSLTGEVRSGFSIADGLPTLAERMQESGYATLAGYANHWLHSVHGFPRGFDRYLRAPDTDELPFVGEALRQRYLPSTLWEVAKGCARATDVNATLLSMLAPWAEGPNPLFVFANYVDAHGPYAPPEPFKGHFLPVHDGEHSEHLSSSFSNERIAQLTARYDEELAYLDHQVGELFRALDQRGLLHSSWIFVTADHGEAFGEHAVFEHGTTVYDEVTHVPLLVFPPQGASLTPTNDPVSLVDVAATVASIGGSTLDGPGRDLRALGASGTHATAIEFYGDALKAAKLGALAQRPARAVIVGHHKLVAYADALELYDLDSDPGEHVNLASALPHLVEQLKGSLPSFQDPLVRAGADTELDDSLSGLGYIGGPNN